MAEKPDSRGRPKQHEDAKSRRKQYRENQKNKGMISFSTYIDQTTKETLNTLCRESGKTQKDLLASLTKFAAQRLDEFLRFTEEER